MTNSSKKTALLLAAFLGIGAVAPVADALAAAPNAINNETVEQQATPVKGSTGIYDNFDQYKDASGRPLQGYGYLWAVPGQ